MIPIALRVSSAFNLFSREKGSVRFCLKGLMVLGLMMGLNVSSVDPETALGFIRPMDPGWDALTVVLARDIHRFSGRVGFYLKDMTTDREIVFGDTRLFPSASLVKVPIMMAILQKVRAGELALNAVLVMKRTDKIGGSGLLKRYRSGSCWSIRKLIEYMIVHSDNTATRLLVELVGTDYLNRAFASDLGLHYTQVQEEPLFSLDPDVTTENFTTPREMGMLLEKLYRRECLSPDYSDMMVDIMKKSNIRTRVARFMPRQWAMADKTGMLRGAYHHVGIVYTPVGNFVVCVLTADGRGYGEAKWFMAQLGRKIFDYYRKRDQFQMTIAAQARRS
ncbi:MAG TPA: class A beta-lactamase-related serine hydrolase [Elusimicrobiota bacterium]|nr:class A beta-lactamase-related serine hydrolase [Elusimicrobiota bacterium]